MSQFVNEDLPSRLGFSMSFAFRALVPFHLNTERPDQLLPDWVQSCSPYHRRRLLESWEAAEQALSQVMEFAGKDLGWTRGALLPSLNPLIAMALAIDRAGEALDSKFYGTCRKWLILAALRGVFHGNGETTMKRFLRVIEKHRPNSVGSPLKGLKRHKAAKVRPEDFLKPARPRDSTTQVLYAWLMSCRATDWVSGKPLQEFVEQGGHSRPLRELAVHHIFPRHGVGALLENASRSNIPANYALVSRGTNERLKDKPPQEAWWLLTAQERQRAEIQYFGEDAGACWKRIRKSAKSSGSGGPSG